VNQIGILHNRIDASSSPNYNDSNRNVVKQQKHTGGGILNKHVEDEEDEGGILER